MSTSGNSSSSSGFRPPTQPGGFNQARQSTYMNQTVSASSSSVMDDAFTPQMRDRQARGKDPYHSGEASEGSDLSDRETNPTSKLRLSSVHAKKEDFARTERRQKAVTYLDNPELLMMYAQSTEDSLPGARLHFMKMLCGYDDESLDDARRAAPPPPVHNSSRRDSDKRRGGDRTNAR
ncbi:hypothetical protein B0T26DRAFT_458467 [Lasiosphaeria miniovina]|uniref:Uncharacterized protein n=1 Tax=Lasiosphaeria miniovina TaxID=1954250 RepID=A0AA40DMB9_9PEZI|nr:uncharacterized protein B0T26DRAFT_458467 [Lasiosphaeria miniovina]KAK0706521.1 hypothetical protein B0T26DRAFT_458467 [Lasiosphaeria miniovina]